jgi:hypothetical protein
MSKKAKQVFMLILVILAMGLAGCGPDPDNPPLYQKAETALEGSPIDPNQ